LTKSAKTRANVATGLVMILVDITIVNIALSSLIAGLNASLGEVLWAINAYLLMYAVVLVPAGRLGDQCGRRNLFACGLLPFTGASAVCGLAQDAVHLILARAVQGLGAGLLTPALALLTGTFPQERRGLALALFGG
jgi:MFS family permease